MSNNFPPKVTALPSVVGVLGTVSASSMIRVEDRDGDDIVEYRIRDNGNAANSGKFSLDGVALPANVWRTLTPAQFSRLIYVGGSVVSSETFSVTVDDGLFRSAVSGGTIATGNSRPELTAEDGRVNANRSVLVTDLFTYSDADGDPIRQMWFNDFNGAVGSGYFELDGVRQRSGEYFQVTAAQLPSLRFFGGETSPRSEFVAAQVYDGVAVSAVTKWLMRTTAPPTIFPEVSSVLVNQSIAASRLFRAVDFDGDAITAFRFVDRLANANGGHFTRDGVRLESAKWHQVDASELNTIAYVGGSFGPQSENVAFRAFDGVWGDEFEQVVTTRRRPTASAPDRSILEAYSFNMAGVITGSDDDGNPVQAYRINDTRLNANGGHFVFKGTRMPSATFFEVPAAEIDQLYYRGGAFGEQKETIKFQVRAGGVWGDVGEAEFSTLENEFRPVVNTFNVSTRLGTVIDFQTMFTWSDADGPPTTIKRVGFYDTGEASDSGYFSINGVQQPAEQWITVPYEQVMAGQVKYHLADRADNELYRVFVNDGRFASAVDTSRIIAVPTPVLASNSNDISLDTIERADVSSFFTQVDDGPAYIQYEIYDENADFRSGRFELDGVDLQQGIVQTLSAAQFDRLVFKGAEADFGRQLDPILIRADNGITGKSEWIRINVNTDPVGARALTSGTRFTNFTATPVTEVTYTFIDGGNQTGTGTRNPDNYGPNSPPIPAYYTPEIDEVCQVPDLNALFCFPGLATLAWSQEQRESARVALANIETYANIKFTEIPYELNTDAQITFGSWGDFDSTLASAAAYTTLPVDGSGSGSPIADIWFDHTDLDWDPRTPTETGLGSFFHFTVLHEVGHTVGFEHPFANDPSLSIFNNFNYLTVMAYESFNNFSQFDEEYRESPSTLQIYDIVELQRIYGVNTNHNSDNTQYVFSEPHQQTIHDAGGVDTLNLTNQTFGLKIDIRQGQWTDLEGMVLNEMGDLELGAWKNSVNIAYGTVIENARGGSGDDTIFGNETQNLLFGNDGADTIQGNGGNDVMRGGLGNDTYVWRLGDGRDAIVETGSSFDPDDDDLEVQEKGDVLQIVDETGALDELPDMVFRRLGNNLRIDLTFNGGEAQGTVLIRDFNNSDRVVETLAMIGPNGAQVGNYIDLTSIFPLASTAQTQFVDTGVVGEFGNIAAPI
jgi:hypothetical protein